MKKNMKDMGRICSIVILLLCIPVTQAAMNENVETDNFRITHTVDLQRHHNNLNLPPSEVWNNSYNRLNTYSPDCANCVRQTTDGGFIMIGDSGYGYWFDIWLVKTDADGHELWNKSFGTEEYTIDGGCCIQQTYDGGYILVGWQDKPEDPPYSSDVWLIKTDKNGIEEWNKTFGGSGADKGYYVQETTDGGYIITGATSSFAAINRGVWLIKTDRNGTELWNKTFGSQYDARGWSVQQTHDNGYIITGSYGVDPYYLWLIKTDAIGTLQWDKKFPSNPGYNYYNQGRSVKQTTDNGYIIAGYTDSYGAGKTDLWLIKTDVNGIEEWNKTFGGTGWDYGFCAIEDTDGGYLITGNIESDGGLLIKTDQSGNKIWNLTFGDGVYYVQQTSDEGYIIAGTTDTYGAGDSDFWLIKLAPENGSILTFNFDLNQNWNLITVPISTSWTAEDLGENISNCTIVTSFDPLSQIFIPHVVGQPHDDFPLMDGVGNFVYIKNNSNLTVTNYPLETVSVYIHTEWNPLGWYHDYSTTAESLGENITSCTLVLMFNATSQSFTTHIVGTPWDNFEITCGMAVFIYTTETSYWHGRG